VELAFCLLRPSNMGTWSGRPEPGQPRSMAGPGTSPEKLKACGERMASRRCWGVMAAESISQGLVERQCVVGAGPAKTGVLGDELLPEAPGEGDEAGEVGGDVLCSEFGVATKSGITMLVSTKIMGRNLRGC
jgi:hypothetical protein